MPKLWQYGPYIFFCYVYDLLNEPAHVHVRAGNAEAKFWLNPVRIAWNHGHKSDDITRIERLIHENQNRNNSSYFVIARGDSPEAIPNAD
ncbi:MAG: DUF4160 domain-containing protein [Caldilineales bacterium]|nr:DUF4160 domain-containing protein [Caldilineales bacterium]